MDTASLYFRAFYGMPDSLRSPDGKPVNAVRGLLDFIARLVEDYQPTHLACCWDNDWRPEWRVELIPTYKTHRVAAGVSPVSTDGRAVAEEAPDALARQVPWIVETLQALGVAIVGADGYEADDVIGTLATRADMPVDIVTGDRDLFQLVDDARQVRILYTARGMSNLESVTDDWVRSKYGVSPAAYVPFATLRGDTSDGLPGVAGIGEKTAAGLLERYGDLEGILAAASDPASAVSGGVRAKLAAGIDYLAVAPTVVAVVRDLDLSVGLDDLRMPAAPPDPEVFTRLAESLGLGGSATRVLAALAARTSRSD
ncbi:5'-3' exonuclease [Microlunatus panaciterrae]|uniref:5'-3' exonuclease n=1 Tax=Microlunatus panaciterrae TaxID=400768 RepID=A0ABS2RDV1_9ACTN|nr:5'-3' exonuclease [Microlunatus panaciterrae]